MTYSIDFRRKVLSVRERDGLTIAQVARRFDIGVASVVRWLKQPGPEVHGYRRRKIDMDALRRDIEQYPDAYQYERAVRFGVHQNTVHHALKKLKVTYKKTLHHPKACAAARCIFQTILGHHKINKRNIVYIDESGFANDMPRAHGYTPQEQRCYGVRDWHAKGRTNAIGALIGKTLLTVGLFNTTVNTDVFTAWLIQDLILKLPDNAVLVMDNATFHKRADTIQAIQKAGHIALFLPPYSPDLNPIEHKWAQAKTLRKKMNCKIDQLFQIESLLFG